jgi:hypothetical protein
MELNCGNLRSLPFNRNRLELLTELELKPQQQCKCTKFHMVDVPEWLSGMTRNHVGFARAGSNPAVHVLYAFSHFQVQMFICNLAFDTVLLLVSTLLARLIGSCLLKSLP